MVIYVIGEVSQRRACMWAVIASTQANRSKSSATRAGHLESQSTHQQSWHLPVAWVGGDLFNVRRERDSHLCPWGVPRCGDSPRGPPDPCRRKTTEGASEQPGNRRIEMRRPRGSWRFGTIGCSGAIICSLGSEPCANMGRLGAISESSGSGTCATAGMGQGAPRKVPRTRAWGDVNCGEWADQ